MNKSTLSKSIGGNFKRENVKCPFALSKIPFYIPWPNALIQNAIFNKGIMNKCILSSSIGGHFKRENVKCPFALSKMPFYIPWQNSLIKNSLLKKGILKKGILSKDIGGHFWEDKRAFPPSRQKPLVNPFIGSTKPLHPDGQCF